MSRQDDRIVRQRENRSLNRPHQGVPVAVGKVRSPHPALKEDVADKDLQRCVPLSQKDDVADRVARCLPNLELQPRHRKPIPLA